MEKYRKCFKCGSSPTVDSDITLFRFPKPGKTNSLRCELWAKFCFPEKEWSSPELQQQLHRQHRMLCNRHFQKTAFADYPISTKKLHRFAVPDFIEIEESASEPQPGSSNVNSSELQTPELHTIVEAVALDTKQPAAKLQPLPGPSHQHSKDVISMTMVSRKEKSPREKYLYAKCRKHMIRLCQLRKKISKLKNKAYLKQLSDNDSMQAMMKKVSPTFALLLQAQIKNFTKKSKGRRWTCDEKIMALRLYKRSPTCYRLMRRLFCLPAQSTLKSLLGQLQLNVGVNKEVLEAMGELVKKQESSDNLYVLMFDEMSIKKNFLYNRKKDFIEGFQDHGHHGRTSQVATHALVFMVAGIRKKVKQPIAYYFSSSYVTADRLAVLIKEVLQECTQVNLNITATVCDMDGVNRRALAILGATAERPCISVDNVEVISLFDPPHLLKCFRNLLLKYDIKCTTHIKSNERSGVGVAKWSHIEEFYKLDSSNPNFVFAPALTADHMKPNSKQKMKVKLAAQLFSHTVAAGMMAKISQGELSTEAATTADVIENLDKLFDALNSNSKDLRRGKVFSTNIKNSTPHLQHFEDMKKFFNSLEFIGCIRTPPSKEGWVWTLNAVVRLWKKITQQHKNIKSLATQRLQQDPLENLFGCIRGNCGANMNPTTGQFVAALKTAVLSNLAQFGPGNCEADNNDAIVNNFKVLLKKRPTNICPLISPQTSDMSEEFERHYEECIARDGAEGGEIQACAYVCGFLVKNIIKDCAKCKEILIVKEISNEHTFVNFKEYNTQKQSLNYCNKNLITYVECCATTVNSLLKTIGHENNLKAKLVQQLMSVPQDFLKMCPNHCKSNVNYLTTSIFYVCVKRYCILQNRMFSEEASKIALRNKIKILKNQ